MKEILVKIQVSHHRDSICIHSFYKHSLSTYYIHSTPNSRVDKMVLSLLYTYINLGSDKFYNWPKIIYSHMIKEVRAKSQASLVHAYSTHLLNSYYVAFTVPGAEDIR